MTKARFNNVQLSVQIMDDGDVEGAINHILGIAGNDRPLRIVKAFDAVRTRILKTDKYRCPVGNQELIRLRDLPTTSEKDKARMNEIIKSPVSRIRWAQSHYNLFEDSDLMRAFKEVRIIKDPFYDFKCPERIVVASALDKKRKIEEDHDHKTHKPEDYHFTMDEVDDYVKQAIEFCESDLDWSRRSNSLRLLEAIGLLTGRRKWEIASSLKIRSVPGFDYQAEVRGIGKKLFESDWRKIPLLAPIDVVVAAISKARRHAHVQGSYCSGKKLFPRLTHTRYRDIYCARAYRDRKENGFHPDSCSEIWWKKCALLSDLEQIANHYSTMVIDRDEPEPEPDHKKQRLDSEPGEEEVADSTGGSSQHQQQDPL